MNKLLHSIFSHQEVVNARFNGSDWRSKVPRTKWRCAAMAEFAEFLDEIEGDWRWWIPHEPNNECKVVEEYVDTLAFAASCCLWDTTQEDILKTIQTEWDYLEQITKSYQSGDCLTRLVNSWNEMMSHNGGRYFIIQMFVYIKAAIEWLGVDENELIKAFHDKHAKNIKRIEAGYMDTGDKTGLE